VGRPALYWVAVLVGAVAGFIAFAFAPGPGGARFAPAAHFVLLLVSAAVLFKPLVVKTVTRLREDYSTEKGTAVTSRDSALESGAVASAQTWTPESQ
jgi:hypothetical protein